MTFCCLTESRLSFTIIIRDFSQAINISRHKPANYSHKSLQHNLHVHELRPPARPPRTAPQAGGAAARIKESRWMIQSMYVFLVFLNIPPPASHRTAGMARWTIGNPHAQMTWEDHYLRRVRWMQVGKDISIAQCLWQPRVSQVRQRNVNVSLHGRLTIS